MKNRFEHLVVWSDRYADPPDTDRDILLALDDGNVWAGWYDGEQWVTDDGVVLDDHRVVYWADLPPHPDAKPEAT